MNIRALKRFAIDQHPEPELPEDIPATGKSVAIIGSGPAGLSAAHQLALLGHEATVYESLPVLGGMLAVGIPDYRLPPDVLEAGPRRDPFARRDVRDQTAPSAETCRPTRSPTDFDAVFVATGAHNSRRLEIPGEDCEDVIHGVDFLRRLTLGEPVELGKRVVIIGGGNTAIDAARTAARLDVDEVTLVYRRTRQEMPADAAEIDAAIAEGIEIHYLAAPVRVLSEAGRMSAVECIRMELGEPDDSGRRRPVPIDGSEFVVAADTLIPAVSQLADQKMAELFGLETTRWETIDADEVTMATSREGVFAGGDVVDRAGQRDRRHRSRQAGGRRHRQLPLGATPRRRVWPSARNGAIPCPRRRSRPARRRPSAPPGWRPTRCRSTSDSADFREVEQVYTAEQARAEAARCLNCADCCECMRCVEACQADAIIHDQQERTLELEVGAVLLTPGFEAFDARRRGEFGFGFARNVVTNVQFERILSASGPTGGQILRPSDGKRPKRLAFIQCVGSRDSTCGNDYCSSVCCMAATKEAILAKEHEPDLEVTIFFLDLRAFGKDFDRYCERAKSLGVRYVRSFISRTYEMPDTHNLRLVYAGPDIEQVEEEFDMVVLSLGLEPSASLREQAEQIGIELNRWGFADTRELSPLDTSRPGVFVGGAFQEPKDIPDTVMQASAAAARAMALLAPARDSRVRTKTYPPERDITDEPPRVGVFVCHCGSNIASVVDVEAVVEHARNLPHVAFAEHSVYTCADDSQEQIKKRIDEHRLNRVVVASCTPRTHEPIFRDTLRDAGLNPYLLEMANIRDQCSWVHSGDPRAGHGEGDRPGADGRGPSGEAGAAPGGDRPGQERRARRRRRDRRHDGRAGAGRPGLSRAPGGSRRAARRHGPAAPHDARRRRRAGVSGRDHRARVEPPARSPFTSARVSPRSTGTSAISRRPSSRMQVATSRAGRARRGRGGHRGDGAQARRPTATARATGS